MKKDDLISRSAATQAIEQRAGAYWQSKNAFNEGRRRGLHIAAHIIDNLPYLDVLKDTPQAMKEQPPAHSGNKYLRTIKSCTVDVYDVLEAFAVACPARQHAIKKLLCTGLRGKGDSLQDLREAGDAIARAIQLEENRLSGVINIEKVVNDGE